MELREKQLKSKKKGGKIMKRREKEEMRTFYAKIEVCIK